MHTIAARVFAAVFVIATGPVPASRQRVSAQDESTLILEGALDGADLSEPGKPYHLSAKIEFEYGDGKKAEGSYQIRWQTEDRFRVDFRLGDLTETDIALGKKYSVLRGGDDPEKAAPIQKFLFEYLILHPTVGFLGARLRADGVSTEMMDGKELICVSQPVERSYSRHVCVDAKTKEAVHLEIRDLERYTSDPKAIAIDLAGFVTVGRHRYPRQSRRVYPTGTARVNITEFREEEKMEEGVFASPAGSQVREWCSKQVETDQHGGQRTVEGLGQPLGEILGPEPYPQLRFYEYSLVSAEGREKKFVRMIYPRPDPLPVFPDRKLPIRTCGETPIEYEVVMTGGMKKP